MNGKKWVILAIVAVIVLSLVATGLTALLVVRTIDELESRDNSRYEDREEEENDDEKDSPSWEQEENVVETNPPMKEVPAVPEPADYYFVALVIPETGDFSAQMTEAFAWYCGELGFAANITTVSTGDPDDYFETFMEHVASGVQAIAVCCPDPSYSEEMALIAQEMGVLYISLDTASGLPPVTSATLHLDGWGSSYEIGSELIYGVDTALGSSGSYCVLSSQKNDSVVTSMEDYLSYNEFGVAWEDTANGNGNFDSCVEAAFALLNEHYPDALVCTDTVSTLAAAQAIMEGGFETKLVGYGNPESLAGSLSFDSTIYYHDAKGLGILAVQAMMDILDGELTLEDGEEIMLFNGDQYPIYWDGDVPTTSMTLWYYDEDTAASVMSYYY